MRRVWFGVTLVAILGLTILAVNVDQVWASSIMVTPSSPSTGQSFTISGTCTANFCEIVAYLGGSCGVSGTTQIVQTSVGSGSYSVAVSGQPAGSGWAAIIDVFPSGGEVCASFTIIPATGGGGSVCPDGPCSLEGRLARDKPPIRDR
ncbi:MAG: hypothetical protein ACHQ03_10895 [Candidatus Bathyarchaeia archaeon]